MTEFPYRFERTHQAAEVAEGWGSLAPEEESGVTVGVAGRIMLSRPSGGRGHRRQLRLAFRAATEK